MLFFRSLYWRIAVGFVALLATLLVVQALLFLWLTGRFVSSASSRTPQQLADQVARELSEALAENPALDIQAHVREHFDDVAQPFAVVMRDGRRAYNRPGVLPRGYPDGPGGAFGPRGPGGPRQDGAAGVDGGGPPPDGAHFGDPDRRLERRDRLRPGEPGAPPPPDGVRARGRGGPGRQIMAPIVLDGSQIGFVAVPAAPPPVSVLLWELGPTLTWSGLGLLVVGAVLASVLIFGPAHKRLRSLGDATKAIGEGRTEVRASEAGGDEVTALAQAFNKMASDLETRASALAASDEARRQLLADVSHELMTPLTAIRGYVQTLAMPHATADQSARERYLSIIDQETYKLETIIGDLLDLARLEGGGGELVLEKVPVTELFRRVLDRHDREIHDREMSMLTTVTPDELHVRGDANRLEQVLQNIAANAIRHTPRSGRIELTAEQRGDFVRIAVRDTGSGIPDEHLPHVFDRFYKADRSRTHASPTAGNASSRATPGGSGLGLSIVRAIVRRHGGTVSAHNVPDGGALFEILLPLEKA
jgi:two-component system OmpR family sensor kinase